MTIGMVTVAPLAARVGVGPAVTITSALRRTSSAASEWIGSGLASTYRHSMTLPIIIGAVRYPGIKIHVSRIIRLLEVLLHTATQVRLCGAAGQQPLSPPAHPSHQPNSKLEAAYHKADKAIERIVDLLKAA